MPEEITREALIVRGGWDGHHPVQATELFIPFLEEHDFTVRVEESTEVYADRESMERTDLIVQCVTMSSIADDELAGLISAVARGSGLVGWHGGIADSFRASAGYLQLVGGQFAAHPGLPETERVGGERDNFVPHRIRITDAGASHPITAGIDDFDLVTEQYWVLSDDYNDVLATTTQADRPGDPWSREVVSPAVWTRHWGAGRIAVATPGHDLTVLSHPSVRTIVERGMLWAAR